MGRTVSHEEHLDAKHTGTLERLRGFLGQRPGTSTKGRVRASEWGKD
jgi:hypothetical protein